MTFYKWIRTAAAKIPEPAPAAEVLEIKWDEVWHFLHTKNKLWIRENYDRHHLQCVLPEALNGVIRKVILSRMPCGEPSP